MPGKKYGIGAGLTTDAAVSLWVKFAEKVQALQRWEYEATMGPFSQGQEPNLRLLIGLTVQEKLAI